MGHKRQEVLFTVDKIYYRPKELVELLDMQETDIVRFAYGMGALYKVGDIRLVNYPVLKESLERYRSLMDSADGSYMEVEEATYFTGLSDEVIVKIAASANALYKVGEFRIIDVKTLDQYIRSFPVKAEEIGELDEEEPKKIRGSKFVREIIKKH